MHRYTWVLALTLLASCPAEASAEERIPFVSCSGFIQGEPLEPPAGKPMATRLPRRIAEALALYDGLQGAVLGPRGWECGFDHGTGSGELLVVPPLSNPDLQTGRHTGPQVRLDDFIRGTSGDYSIAAFAGLYFPREVSNEFMSEVIERFHTTRKELLIPRYPDDVVRYRSRRMLEFMTPPNHQGLGTSAYGVGTSPLPTYGVLALETPEEEGAMLLTIRLPPELNYLHAAILRHFERCMALETQQLDEIMKCESGGAETSRGGAPLPEKP